MTRMMAFSTIVFSSRIWQRKYRNASKLLVRPNCVVKITRITTKITRITTTITKDYENYWMDLIEGDGDNALDANDGLLNHCVFPSESGNENYYRNASRLLVRPNCVVSFDDRSREIDGPDKK